MSQLASSINLSSQGSSPYKRRQMVAGLLQVASICYNYVRLFNVPSHRRCVKAAARALTKIRAHTGADVEASTFTFVRKINPNVFEEMVLTSLQSGGRLVLRNLRYTCDDGEDGRFYEPGTGWMLVQCKRYSAHISAEHVRDFHRLVRTTGCAGGIFVHSGKAGAAAFILSSGDWSRVVMVSESGLMDLLLRGELP